MTFIDTGFLRLRQIIGDPKADPPVPAIIPVSRSTFLKGVKEGHFPAPIKLSKRCTAWRARDIMRICKEPGGQGFGEVAYKVAANAADQRTAGEREVRP